jgi:hypothetical protein
MEKYYTFLCETYNGDKLEICVLANSEDHARERLSDYEVSRGELHYICKLLDVSEKGTEKYYHSNNNSIALAIAFCGAALGIAQTSRYYSNDNRKIIDSLTGETIQLIRS